MLDVTVCRFREAKTRYWLARNTEYQVATVKKDVLSATQHPDLEGLLEDQHSSSPGLFHQWLTEHVTSWEGFLERFLLVCTTIS